MSEAGASRAALSVAPDPGSSPGGYEQRVAIAAFLDKIGEVCRSHNRWSCAGVEFDPPVAALIVLVSPDGEPVSMFVGDAWSSKHREDLTTDVHSSISDMTWMGRDYAQAHEEWQEREARRTRYRLKQAADDAELARTHPFLCDRCGKRCKSPAGLTRHCHAFHPTAAGS